MEKKESKKMYFGFIAGGRADTDVHIKRIDVPLNEQLFFKWLEESNYAPNQDSDNQNIYNIVKKGKGTFVTDDVFGEGVVGVSKSVSKLKNKLRGEFFQYDDEEEDY